MQQLNNIPSEERSTAFCDTIIARWEKFTGGSAKKIERTKVL